MRPDIPGCMACQRRAHADWSRLYAVVSSARNTSTSTGHCHVWDVLHATGLDYLEDSSPNTVKTAGKNASKLLELPPRRPARQSATYGDGYPVVLIADRNGGA